MKQVFWILAFAPVALLTNCTQVKTPAPSQPRLEAVRLVGPRVCGQFSVPGTTYEFTCAGLPTVAASGWQLTPSWQTLANDKQKPNRTVVLTLSTPSATQLQIDYEPSSTATWHLRQKAPGPGSPLPVSSRG